MFSKCIPKPKEKLGKSVGTFLHITRADDFLNTLIVSNKQEKKQR